MEIRRGQHVREEAIRNLTELNGIPIAELERRMRPNKGEGAGPSIYSYDGFLGPNEGLIDVLLRQNEIVENSGFTHKLLANYLSLALLHLEEMGGRRARFEEFDFQFEITKHTTVSSGQFSPFRNEFIVDDDEAEDWDGEYILKNLTTGRILKFTDANIRWIRKWGFYEGFETPYFIDPQRLIDIFSKEDVILETRDEYRARLMRKYLKDGWKEAILDYPLEACENFPNALTDLKFNWFEDDEKTVATFLLDKRFILVMKGTYDPFYEHGVAVVVYDNMSGKLLYKCVDVAKYEVRREVIDGTTKIRIEMLEIRAERPTIVNSVLISNRMDKYGWLITASGEPTVIGDFRFFSLFGRMDASSDDQVYSYENERIQFVTHKRGNCFWFIYIIEKNSGWKERVALNKGGLGLLGLPELNEDSKVTEIKDIECVGLSVSGIMVIDGKEYKFSV